MVKTGIYRILSPSNKIYIGQSTNLKRRVYGYKSGNYNGQPKLAASLDKYKWENHSFDIVMPLRNDISQEWLNYWEVFFMDFFKNDGHELLNLKQGGSNGKHSEETRLKMSKIRQKHVPFLRERFKGVNNPMYGKKGELHHSFGKKVSEDVRLRMKLAQKGKVHSEEWKNNLSIAMKKRFALDPTSNPMYGRKQSEEFKELLRKKRGADSLAFKGFLSAYKDGEFVGIFEGISDAARKLKLSQGNIHTVLKGKYSHTKGYSFMFHPI